MANYSDVLREKYPSSKWILRTDGNDQTSYDSLEWVKNKMGSTAMSDAQAYGKMMIEAQKSDNKVGVVTNTIPWT